jgi:hypothetical protein
VKLPLFILILCLGCIGWTTAYWLWQPIRAEANQVWQDYQTRQLNKGIGGSVKEETPKTESYVPADSAEVHYVASREVELNSPPSTSVEEILPKIYQLESSGGKNDLCRQKGLVNGYGFAQNKFTWRCYKTKAEVEKEVAEWFTKNLQNKTLAESLCYYNQGIITSDCEYAKKFAFL